MTYANRLFTQRIACTKPQSLSKTYKWTKLHLWQYIRSQYIQFSVSAKQNISRNTCRLTVCSSIFSYERKLISVRRKFWHDFPIKKKVACSKLHVSPFRIDIFNSLALYLCILENTACTCTRFRLCLRFSFCFARMRIKVCVYFFFQYVNVYSFLFTLCALAIAAYNQMSDIEKRQICLAYCWKIHTDDNTQNESLIVYHIKLSNVYYGSTRSKSTVNLWFGHLDSFLCKL